MTAQMRRASLEELCSLVTDGTHDSPKLLQSGVPFIKGKHISSGRIDFDACDYISHEDHLAVIARSKPERGDTLFSNIGSVGDAAYVNTDEQFSIKNVALLKPDPAKIDPLFLFYLVRSDKVKGEILSAKSGSAQPFISLGSLRRHQVDIPASLQTQQRIAAILGAYDDLIEVNRRRVAVLEEMARGLFEEWFVRFRFPGHEGVPLVDTPDGPLPEGWQTSTVKPLVKRVPVNKRFSQKSASSEGRVPILDQGKQGVIGYHDGKPTVNASEAAPVIVFANHTCYQKVVHFSFSAIQNVLPFLPSESAPNSIYWLHHATSNLVVLNDYKGHWPELMAKVIAVPTPDLAARFDRLVGPIHVLVHQLKSKDQSLAASRDLLLPRLISGQLSVEAAERELEDAA